MPLHENFPGSLPSGHDGRLPPLGEQHHPFRRFGPVVSAPPSGWTHIPAGFVLKDAFRFHTLLALGAAAQIGLIAVVPGRWACVPVAAALGVSLVSTLLQLTVFRRSHALLDGVVPGRTTARPPTTTPGAPSPPLVVFHFGCRINHPLGLLGPGGAELTALFNSILHELHADQARGPAASVYGLLGADLFRGAARAAHDTLFVVFFFRDTVGLHRFAHDPLHLRALRWLADPRLAHMAAFHETFHVPAGSYETLYLNAAPTLLGATHWPTTAQAAEDDDPRGATDDKLPRHKPAAAPVGWQNPLVDANDRRLHTMAARLGQLQ